MLHVNFTRPTHFLLISLSLMAAGCSEAPKEPLSVSDQLPSQTGDYAQSEGYGQYSSASSRLKFHQHKSPSDHNSQHNTVWDRLLSLYQLPEVDNYRVERAVDWYLQHPASLATIQQRAEPYLYHILEEVEAKHIPGELALLPVVESAFVANAYSTADASGLWQFIPSTGEEYGLEQNAWYDGRRDVHASTKAATTYLKELSENFDDKGTNDNWLLALASYNCGKNRVKRAIEKNADRDLPTDYWSLDLPQETMDYVPRLLAIAKIFANAEAYNIDLRHIPNKPYFEMVDIKSPLDLHKAAQLANTPYDKFLKLNPGFNKSCTAPQGPHHLLVPVEHAQAFKRNLAQIPYSERVNFGQIYEETSLASNYQSEERIVTPSKKPEIRHDDIPAMPVANRHVVKSGETLLAIAYNNHTSIGALRQANHLAGNTVRRGMSLQLPSTSTSRKIEPQPLLAKAEKIQTSNNQIYAVKKGDTFWNISQRFAVSPKEVAEWNKITLKTALVPGRKLTIKAPHQQLASVSSVRLVHYKVGNGDNLTQIAKKFNVSIGDLRKSNGDILAKGLRPGQKLKIIIDGQPST